MIRGLPLTSLKVYPEALLLALLPTILIWGFAEAQTRPGQLEEILAAPLISPDVVNHELDNYLMKRVPPLRLPQNAAQWTARQKEIRSKLLKEVVFHGWPEEWISGSVKAVEVGEPYVSELGYRIKKIRYEIVPGFYGAALLYEPVDLKPGMPAMLNVNGHGMNKASEWKQKRCINLALRGILSLNLEWFYYGELHTAENYHDDYPQHLDLAGASGLGLFYLAMRRGLDFLYDNPNVDRHRIGMTGLSGGGWQTIILSALDERIKVSIPVAGYCALSTRLEVGGGGYLGDFEQLATDMLKDYEYTHFTAMIAPRWALLIHNARDIFRSHLVKPLIFDQLVPFWELYGAGDRFAFHENTDPADHNYDLDNRLQAYAFTARGFGLSPIDEEINVDQELKTEEELTVGLPENNLTILGVARKLADRIVRERAPDDASRRKDWLQEKRKRLKDLVHFEDVSVDHVWTKTGTRQEGLETRSSRFDFSDGLNATGVWLHAIEGRREGLATIVLHDEGKKASSRVVSDRTNRGEIVLALDLLLTGDMSLPDRRPERHAQVLPAVGERPLGIRAAHLLAVTDWLRKRWNVEKVRLEVVGMRSQVLARVVAGLFPKAFSEVVVHKGISSLRVLYDKPVKHVEAPELFCLDLYKEYDLDLLERLGE